MREKWPETFYETIYGCLALDHESVWPEKAQRWLVSDCLVISHPLFAYLSANHFLILHGTRILEFWSKTHHKTKCWRKFTFLIEMNQKFGKTKVWCVFDSFEETFHLEPSINLVWAELSEKEMWCLQKWRDDALSKSPFFVFTFWV